MMRQLAGVDGQAAAAVAGQPRQRSEQYFGEGIAGEQRAAPAVLRQQGDARTVRACAIGLVRPRRELLRIRVAEQIVFLRRGIILLETTGVVGSGDAGDDSRLATRGLPGRP